MEWTEGTGNGELSRYRVCEVHAARGLSDWANQQTPAKGMSTFIALAFQHNGQNW